MNETSASSRLNLAGAGNTGYKVIFFASFVVFLAVAVVAQLLALRWRTWFPGAEGGRSLVEDVRSAVYTFMSYLT